MENNIENNIDFISKQPEAGQEEAEQENKKRQKEIREKYLQYFIDCRDKYNKINKIPEEMVWRISDEIKDFFQYIISRLRLVIDMKIINDPESINKINKFIEYAQTFAYKKETDKENKPVNKKDINEDKVNEIIDYAIEILS